LQRADVPEGGKDNTILIPGRAGCSLSEERFENRIRPYLRTVLMFYDEDV
jgi:hypothetical protein